jgi:hypothetical protein
VKRRGGRFAGSSDKIRSAVAFAESYPIPLFHLGTFSVVAFCGCRFCYSIVKLRFTIDGARLSPPPKSEILTAPLGARARITRLSGVFSEAKPPKKQILLNYAQLDKFVINFYEV